MKNAYFEYVCDVFMVMAQKTQYDWKLCVVILIRPVSRHLVVSVVFCYTTCVSCPPSFNIPVVK